MKARIVEWLGSFIARRGFIYEPKPEKDQIVVTLIMRSWLKAILKITGRYH